MSDKPKKTLYYGNWPFDEELHVKTDNKIILRARRPELPVDQLFSFEGSSRVYKVIKGEEIGRNCTRCQLRLCNTFKCTSTERSDENDVYFIEVSDDKKEKG